MGVLGLTLLLVVADPVDDGLAKKMLPIYVKEAESYSLAIESGPKKPLELRKEPVFEWLNPAREGVQQGAVFVWLRDGRPAALGCIFSTPKPKGEGRMLTHEFHALDPEKLIVTRPKDALNSWKPEAGLDRKELTDAPVPADTAGGRLIQMKKLAAEFTGYSVDREKKRWDLRLLPTPLYRYPAAKTGVIDGGLFTLVSSAGTDPEVLVLIEAKEANGKVKWEYALGRFSDWELRVQRKEKEVWSSVPSADNPASHGPGHLYRVFEDKVVNLEGKLLERIRQTPKGPEFIPVEEK
jgi:hypothetical protein